MQQLYISYVRCVPHAPIYVQPYVRPGPSPDPRNKPIQNWRASDNSGLRINCFFCSDRRSPTRITSGAEGYFPDSSNPYVGLEAIEPSVDLILWAGMITRVELAELSASEPQEAHIQAVHRQLEAY